MGTVMLRVAEHGHGQGARVKLQHIMLARIFLRRQSREGIYSVSLLWWLMEQVPTPHLPELSSLQSHPLPPTHTASATENSSKGFASVFN